MVSIKLFTEAMNTFVNFITQVLHPDNNLFQLDSKEHISKVSCQKGPTRHAYAWQIGPFWKDTLDLWEMGNTVYLYVNIMADLSKSITMSLMLCHGVTSLFISETSH